MFWLLRFHTPYTPSSLLRSFLPPRKDFANQTRRIFVLTHPPQRFPSEHLLPRSTFALLRCSHCCLMRRYPLRKLNTITAILFVHELVGLSNAGRIGARGRINPTCAPAPASAPHLLIV